MAPLSCDSLCSSQSGHKDRAWDKQAATHGYAYRGTRGAQASVVAVVCTPSRPDLFWQVSHFLSPGNFKISSLPLFVWPNILLQNVKKLIYSKVTNSRCDHRGSRTRNKAQITAAHVQFIWLLSTTWYNSFDQMGLGKREHSELGWF